MARITPPPFRGEQIVDEEGRALRKFQRYLDNLDPEGISGSIDEQVQAIQSGVNVLQSFQAELRNRLDQLDAQVPNNVVSMFNMENGRFARPPKLGNVSPNDVFASNAAFGTVTFRTDIGGQTPQVQMEYAGATAFSQIRNSNDASGAEHILGKTRGTAIGDATIVQDNDVLGQWTAVAGDGSDVDTIVGRMTFEVDDASPAAGAIGGAWVLYVATTGGALTDVLRVRPDEIVWRIGDNDSAAYTIQQALNDYFAIDTTNGAEKMTFGNTTTNPDYEFAGTGTFTAPNISLTLTSGNLTLTNGNITATNGTVNGQNVTSDSGFGMAGVGAQAQQSHISDPSGGATIDAEARTAIDAILVVLETFGFTATS